MSLTFLPSIIRWPDMLMRDTTIQWSLAARNMSGGRALSGAMPMMRLDGGGIWTATLGDVQVSRADHVRVWHALQARLDGGATPVILSNRMAYTGPYGTSTDPLETTANDNVSASDDATFVTPPIIATLTEAADLRATTLTIAFVSGAALRGGEYLSIEHNTYSHRMYQVAAVSLDGDGNSVVTIRPPLREATDAGTPVEFDAPCCVMQLADPSAMDLTLARRIFGQASVKFLESFPPWS